MARICCAQREVAGREESGGCARGEPSGTCTDRRVCAMRDRGVGPGVAGGCCAKFVFVSHNAKLRLANFVTQRSWDKVQEKYR
jgi:hypothetical protein